MFAQVQQEVRCSAGRRAASPRPSVPQELYVALGADIGVHHFLPVDAAVCTSRVINGYTYGIAVLYARRRTTTVNYCCCIRELWARSTCVCVRES